MFIRKISGKKSINDKAFSIGCETGECVHGSGYGRPSIVGNTFAIKETLKAAGARWDSNCKAWTFESWAALESAIDSVAK